MSRKRSRSQHSKELICLCNEVSKEAIENCIRDGASTLNEIFDRTTAGVGPCGGTCRGKLDIMLQQYLRDGSFPETFISSKKKTRKR